MDSFFRIPMDFAWAADPSATNSYCAPYYCSRFWGDADIVSGFVEEDSKHAMSVLTIQLSESLRKSVSELARREDISVDQFIASAVGEKMASLMTLEYLRSEERQGKLEEFE